jgi:3-deoxy-D-manno-octulosonic-acid transferase
MISWITFSIYRFILVPVAVFLLRICKNMLPEKLKVMVEERESPNWPQLSSRPLWIHASSGEIEYAKSTIRALKDLWPQRLILITYFSPSAKKLIKSLGNVDAIVPLPWDEKKKVHQFLAHFKPEILLIARTDVWPEFAYQTKKSRIPSILFAATFATESKRQGLFSSPLTRFAFNQLTLIHCVSEEDEAEIQKLGASTKIEIAGDTRYDQVLWRLEHPLPLQQEFDPPDRTKSNHLVFVAGSTWPQDEAILLPALPHFIKSGGRVVIAPHEVGAERIDQLISQLRALNLSTLQYSQGSAWNIETTEVLVVDQIGSLQEIYSWGDLAFVGGSFKDKVHSVMEPLAAGLPVLVGPFHSNNREALHFQHVLIDRVPAVTVIQDFEDLAIALHRFYSKQKDIPQIKIGLKSKVHSRAGATTELITQIVSYCP